MQAVAEFMQEFLLAERDLHRRFAELEREMWARFSVVNFHRFDLVEHQARWNNLTEFESSIAERENATAIATVIRHTHWVTLARYKLCRKDAAWRISSIGYFCGICNGSGKSSAKGEVCSICHGVGYFTAPELSSELKQSESESSPPNSMGSAMPDIDAFMHEFLLAERALHRHYVELDKEMWAGFAVPELHRTDLADMQAAWNDNSQVETFIETGREATVTATVVRSSPILTLARYSLCEVKGAWRISGLKYACGCCNGNGMAQVSKGGSEFEEDSCFVCHGNGWLDPFKRRV